MTELVPVFDGHNDTLLRLYRSGSADPATDFLKGTAKGHIDLPRARQGGFAGGFFAMFPPAPGKSIDPAGSVSDVPLASGLLREDALAATLGMASILFRIERASDGAFAVCRKTAELRSAMQRGAVAAIFHIEGAEAVDTDLAALDVLYAAGLRSLGIVWSRPNAFGHGVPFRFPSSPDTGPGLTDAGKALVKACNRMKIMIDLSHLNEKGFRDVVSLTDAPLVATHSNVHALSPHSRNLTAWQLGAIRDSGGMVGLNFAPGFLRDDGRMIADTRIEVMVRHVDALLEALGEDGVGLGSDFDGAVVPAPVGDCTGLPKLIEAFRAAGYGPALIEKIAWKNWIGMLERTIG
jgi:membrane dipeptidase